MILSLIQINIFPPLRGSGVIYIRHREYLIVAILLNLETLKRIVEATGTSVMDECYLVNKFQVYRERGN